MKKIVFWLMCGFMIASINAMEAAQNRYDEKCINFQGAYMMQPPRGLDEKYHDLWNQDHSHLVALIKKVQPLLFSFPHLTDSSEKKKSMFLFNKIQEIINRLKKAKTYVNQLNLSSSKSSDISVLFQEINSNPLVMSHSLVCAEEEKVPPFVPTQQAPTLDTQHELTLLALPEEDNSEEDCDKISKDDDVFLIKNPDLFMIRIVDAQERIENCISCIDLPWHYVHKHRVLEAKLENILGSRYRAPLTLQEGVMICVNLCNELMTKEKEFYSNQQLREEHVENLKNITQITHMLNTYYKNLINDQTVDNC